MRREREKGTVRVVGATKMAERWERLRHLRQPETYVADSPSRKMNLVNLLGRAVPVGKQRRFSIARQRRVSQPPALSLQPGEQQQQRRLCRCLTGGARVRIYVYKQSEPKKDRQPRVYYYRLLPPENGRLPLTSSSTCTPNYLASPPTLTWSDLPAA